MITLYIENTPADLTNEVIPLTRQVHDLTNLETRQGNFSRTFNLPLTGLNKTLLGFPNEVNSTSNIPYTRVNAMLAYNGVQDVGYIEILNADKDFAECVFYSGNSDLFEIIGNKTLNDLDLSDYDTMWDISGLGTTFFDVKSATSGVVWPLVETGVGEVYRALPVDNREVNAKALRPAIYTKSLLEKICDLANYTIVGDFINDERYNKEAIYVTEQEPKHTDLYNAQQAASVELSAPFLQNILPTQNFTLLVGYDVVLTDAGFNYSNPYYTVPAPGLYTVIVNYEITQNNSAPIFGNIKILKRDTLNNLIELAVSEIAGLPVNTFFNCIEAECFKDDEIYVVLDITNNDPVLDTDISFYSSMAIGAPIDTAIVYGNLFEPTNNMPDMPLKEFIRAFCVRYNLLIISDRAQQTIEFVPFKELYINDAYDWSNKIDTRDKTVQFKSQLYGQTNIFRYLDDNQYPFGYATGTITLANENVKEETILKQPFGASVDVTRLKGLSCPQIPMYLFDEADIDNLPVPEYAEYFLPTFNNYDPFLQQQLLYNGKQTPQSVTPRIIYINQTLLSADPIIYKDGPFSFVSGPLSTEPLAWFWNDTQPYNLSFDSTKTGNSLLTDNYTELQFMLDKFKIVTAAFNLNAADVLNHDFTRPVYISYLNAYFYVNKIKDYQPNKLTEVELIKL